MGAVKFYDAVLLDAPQQPVIRHRIEYLKQDRPRISAAPQARSNAQRAAHEPYGILLPGDQMHSVMRMMFSVAVIALAVWTVLP